MNTAILLAAGSGRRMSGALADKVLAPLHGGLPSLGLCMRAFARSGCVGRIVVAYRDAEQLAQIDALAADLVPGIPLVRVQGGAERADSVLAALETIPDDGGLAFVHDAARPLVEPSDIRKLEALAMRLGAAAVARPVTDTIKRAFPAEARSAQKLEDVPRASLRAMETPQVFPVSLLRSAYRAARERGLRVTDDAAAAALLDVHPALLDPGHPNPKLTGPEDIAWVNFLLSRTSEQEPKVPQDDKPPFRIGHGYDIHRFAQGRRLVLGGVEIPHTRGLEGHSDADCLCHALADAVLGAAGLPDIGHYYPPGRPETKDMDSLDIVRGAVAKAAALGLRVGNADISLVAQEPKVAGHIPAMKER
ncbi:MAG: 2-C-methyl-D-erythritol 2,4-cyclodiphosphate synthase, partial [Opitutales bacterium]